MIYEVCVCVNVGENKRRTYLFPEVGYKCITCIKWMDIQQGGLGAVWGWLRLGHWLVSRTALNWIFGSTISFPDYHGCMFFVRLGRPGKWSTNFPIMEDTWKMRKKVNCPGKLFIALSSAQSATRGLAVWLFQTQARIYPPPKKSVYWENKRLLVYNVSSIGPIVSSTEWQTEEQQTKTCFCVVLW